MFFEACWLGKLSVRLWFLLYKDNNNDNDNNDHDDNIDSNDTSNL